MSTLPGLFCVDNKSYQHLQGVMLVNLNRIALEEKLSHSEYRLMGVLIGYWNKKHQKAYPSLRMIAKTARMSNSTVIKAINNLKKLGLIVVTKDGRAGRNNYHINCEKFFTPNSNSNDTPKVIPISTSCSSTKHIKNKTDIDKNITKNDNDYKNTSNKKLVTQLKQWNISDTKKLLEMYPDEAIKDTINITRKNSPNNPGAYFRSIISKVNPLEKLHENNLDLSNLLKSKYIEHKPSGKIFQIRPDQGNHYLFKYFKENSVLMLIDSGFKDVIDNFEPALEEDYFKKNKITYLKPSKKEIIKLLEASGDTNQVEQLKTIWKLN